MNGGRLDLILDARASQSSVDTVDSNVDAILVDTGTTLPASLSAIETDTQDLQTQIGTAGAGLSAIPWNSTWDAEVQSEVVDGINATFTFTVAGNVDANTQYINDAEVVGDGNATPWDGA